MDWRHGSDRVVETPDCDSVGGRVIWSPVKSLWIGGHTLIAILAGPFVFNWSALGVFLVLCAITLCAGHSVGMHRRLIHNSFDCPLWLEYAMVYAGVLVGMAGPFGLMQQHDLRDWAQRKPDCHAFLCHRNPILKDAWWQLHCDLKLLRPPNFVPEVRVREDRVYLWMERTWMWHQLPLGAFLFWLGGWSFVVWGVCARVSICVTGHWLVGYFAHNDGPRRWHVRDAGVQGRDVPVAALPSMGESWHNNHHAYPGSARIGLDADQPDPGWWLIVVLRRLGFAWNVQTPETLDERAGLQRVSESEGGCHATRAWQRAISH